MVAIDNFNKVSSCQHRHVVKKQGNDEPHSHESVKNEEGEKGNVTTKHFKE